MCEENNQISEDFVFSPVLFDRSPRKVKKRSNLFRYRLRIYCALHRPVSLKSRLYHYIITALILYSCVVVNVFDENFGSYAALWMAFTDAVLSCS
jgi:hypothetical protein